MRGSRRPPAKVPCFSLVWRAADSGRGQRASTFGTGRGCPKTAEDVPEISKLHVLPRRSVCVDEQGREKAWRMWCRRQAEPLDKGNDIQRYFRREALRTRAIRPTRGQNESPRKPA
ncbi:hypothetical protein LX36DRAFT_658163 [Colletotrichum falcatum]|nr:hypothetical protein LX36DRAFT_658163 [Colletotrichum falcatum]